MSDLVTLALASLLVSMAFLATVVALAVFVRGVLPFLVAWRRLPDRVQGAVRAAARAAGSPAGPTLEGSQEAALPETIQLLASQESEDWARQHVRDRARAIYKETGSWAAAETRLRGELTGEDLEAAADDAWQVSANELTRKLHG